MMVETPKGLTDSSSTNPNHVNTSSPNIINPNHFFLNFDQPIINSSDHLSFWKPTSSSSSKPDMIAGAGDFCHQEEVHLLQRSTHQGLSLSLSNSTNPGIGIQSFDNHQQQLLQTHHSGKSTMYMHDDDYEFLIRKQAAGNTTASSAGVVKYQTAPSNFLTSSIYLLPAQHLLNEFCNLGTSNQNKKHSVTKAFQMTNHFQHQDHNSSSNFSSKTVPLNSTEFMELQKRKSRLLQMLDEVDRKYHNYCDQMKAVVSSFEAVAGNGAATVYSALASKAMSRHFRCLRDGIVGQIKAIKMAMGEKDNSAPGATKGETPRLRLLDQTLRQQRAFQQMITMDCHPWRPQRGLPERSVSVLRAWLFEHFLHPYPSDVDKHILARQTGLSRSQVSNWFINARVRLWKPMVEEMYVEETKDNNGDDEMNIQSVNISDKFNAVVDDDENMITRIPKIEQKPTAESADHCLSSFINTLEQHQRLSADSFGTVDIDFSSYNHNSFDIVNGGRVSLNLGLQQHASGGGDGGEVSLYYPRDGIDEDCQTAVVEYSSVLEGDDQGQNLPYRNLTGSQLLHDLAG